MLDRSKMRDHHKPEGRNGSQAQPHEQFLELCALSTAGELSEDERKRLEKHLAGCAECRRAFEEFESVAGVGAPLLAARLAEFEMHRDVSSSAEGPQADPAAFLQIEDTGPNLREGNGESAHPLRNRTSRPQMNWNYLWVPFAAAIALIAALGIYSYQAGTRHGSEIAQTHSTARTDGKIESLEQKLSDTGHERELLQAQLVGHDRLIRDLRHQLGNVSAALNEVKNAKAGLERRVQKGQAEKQQVAQEQNELRQKLSAAEASLETTKVELASAQHDRQRDQLLGRSLEAQVNDLNAELRTDEQAISKRDDLLSYDRDIRDLIGARDLYIAEVYDVARDGSTRKPYGRIFYTKGKSLVFYAYDLEQQSGVKSASTFQAWGQRGPDRQQAVNLGIFYQDSVANKRWVLKFDDPRKLAQINAVFVTVEPHGGSRKPDGKSLLFASLRIQPNHP